MTNATITTDLETYLHEMACRLRLKESNGPVIRDEDDVCGLLIEELALNIWGEPGPFVHRFADAASDMAARVDPAGAFHPSCLADLTLLLLAADAVYLSTRNSDGSPMPNTREKQATLARFQRSLVSGYGSLLSQPWGEVVGEPGDNQLEIDQWGVPVDLWFLPWASLTDPTVIAELEAHRCPECCHPVLPAASRQPA